MGIEVKPTWVSGILPITAEVGTIKIAGRCLADLIRGRFPELEGGRSIKIRTDFFPSEGLVKELASGAYNLIIRDGSDGVVLAESTVPGSTDSVERAGDVLSLRIARPWDLLKLNELLVGALDHNEILGTVRTGATLDGLVKLGSGSVILPGVYIEGNVVIGSNCKIGPNCYIRGNTSIGDNCHIGQAVEIKNSVLQDKVSVGHLSYAGDSFIGSGVNFGAGTIISNLRHDGRNHRWMAQGVLVDTGRRKFGAIIGEGVHTGIYTSIYPGRSLSAGSQTLPGEVVSHSK